MKTVLPPLGSQQQASVAAIRAAAQARVARMRALAQQLQVLAQSTWICRLADIELCNAAADELSQLAGEVAQ